MFGLATSMSEGGPINGLASLALIVPSIAVTVRRLHDTNRSGWWLALPLVLLIVLVAIALGSGAFTADGGEGLGVPAIIMLALLGVSAIALFVFMLLPGNQGSNSYGPDPYSQDDLERVFA